ncbi:hypothetical protein Tco_0948444, partial [Tanacetum coccineum]
MVGGDDDGDLWWGVGGSGEWRKAMVPFCTRKTDEDDVFESGAQGMVTRSVVWTMAVDAEIRRNLGPKKGGAEPGK